MTTDLVAQARETLVPGGCYCCVMRKAVAVAVFAAFVVGACSGSDEAASTGPTVAELATTVTEPATTTEAPATSAVVETTIAPTTTVDDQARLRAAEQAYIAAWEAYHAAILDPSDPDLRAEVERLFAGPNLEGFVDGLDGFVEAGVIARPHPDVPADVSILAHAKEVPGESDLIDLVGCEVNSEWYVEVGTAPDGSDAIVRDEIFVYRVLTRMRLIEGQWRSESGETLSERVGNVPCMDLWGFCCWELPPDCRPPLHPMVERQIRL
jgi:hypothetical protein